MNFSTMTYTFSRQKEHFDLDRMLRFTAEHMDGIDFVTLHDQPAKELRARADDLGIPVVCHTFFSRSLTAEDPADQSRGMDDCKRGIEAAVVLGAPAVMIPTLLPPADVSREAWRRRWIDGLRRVMPVAQDAGVALTIENFPGEHSAFVLAADFEEARDAVPGLKLTYDNGNAASGEDPAESFARCAPYVVHAHFKDWLIRENPEDGFKPMLNGRWFRPALIGEGDIDHRACLRAMEEAGYDGCINIEYEGNEVDPFTATRKAVAYLRALSSEHR